MNTNQEIIENPFPGLRSFSPDENHIFFGRDIHLNDLLTRLRLTRFLSVIGSSGSGKSSLIHAGLLPSLHAGYMAQTGSRWKIASMRPGSNPIANLADAIFALKESEMDPERAFMERSFIEANLRRGNRGLIEYAEQLNLLPDESFLVFVDQFEELFRFSQKNSGDSSVDEAAAFIKILLTSTQQTEIPIFVVLTMRSDFLSNCTQFHGLPEAINDGQYLVPRLSREQKKMAIEGPIAVSGSSITPRLVQRLLNDVKDDPDQLPVMQHALMRTWDLWKAQAHNGDAIDIVHYEEIGGMSDSLSRHLDEAYSELRTDKQKYIAKRMFQSLAEKKSNSSEIRRPTKISEIQELTKGSLEEVRTVVERFRLPGRSFIMPAAHVTLEENSLLDISHESMMRVWSRYKKWIEEEATSAQTYIRLVEASQLYQEERIGVWKNPELQEAINWRERFRPTQAWAKRYHPAYDRAITFLDYSKQQNDFEESQKELRRKKQLRSARIFSSCMGLAALVFLGFMVAAFVLWGDAKSANAIAEEARKQEHAKRIEANEQRNIAERKRQEADSLLHISMVAKSKEKEARLVSEKQREIAEQATIQAWEEEKKAKDALTIARKLHTIANNAQDSLAQEKIQSDNLREEAEKLRMQAVAQSIAIQSQSEISSGNHKIGAHLAMQAFLLNKNYRGPKQQADIFSALFAAYKKICVNQYKEQQYFADLPVNGLLFLNKNTVIVQNKNSESPILWSIAREATVPTFPKAKGIINDIALAPDRNIIGIVTENGFVTLYSNEGKRLIFEKLFEKRSITRLAFNNDSRHFAVASATGEIEIWDRTSPATAYKKIETSKKIEELVFLPHQASLAFTCGKSGLMLWEYQKTNSAKSILKAPTTALAVSENGQSIAVGDKSGVIYLFNHKLQLIEQLKGHRSGITQLLFCTNDHSLTSASWDNSLRIWNMKDRKSEPIILKEHTSWIWAIARSFDGTKLVSGGYDKKVHLWHTTSDLLYNQLCKRVSDTLSKDIWIKFAGADIPLHPLCQD